MLKDLLSNRLFIGALALFVLCVGGSLLYMQHVEQQGAEYAAETQDRVAQWNEKQTEQPTAEVPVGDTSQGGHFHEDGTWHGEPHAPVDVSEVEASADAPSVSDVRAAPVVAQQANTEIDAATLESASRRLKDPDVYKAWVEWSKKNKELSEAFSQANWDSINAGPKTEEEQKRFNNDPEWQRRYDEALHESARIYTMKVEHEKKNPLLQ